MGQNSYGIAMQILRTTIIFLMILVYVPFTIAEELFIDSKKLENKSPIDKYHLTSKAYLATCKVVFMIARVKAETEQLGGEVKYDKTDDYESCIDEGRAITKTELDKVLQSVNKPKAQEALKNYHVVFITALEGIKSGIEERKISYDERQQTLEDKVTEAWIRFELEQ